MNYPPMTHDVTEHTAERVTLDIHHDPRQSYARAVQPCAMRTVRPYLARGRQWALVDVDYDVENPDPARCTTRYTFTINATAGAGR